MPLGFLNTAFKVYRYKPCVTCAAGLGLYKPTNPITACTQLKTAQQSLKETSVNTWFIEPGRHIAICNCKPRLGLLVSITAIQASDIAFAAANWKNLLE